MAISVLKRRLTTITKYTIQKQKVHKNNYQLRKINMKTRGKKSKYFVKKEEGSDADDATYQPEPLKKIEEEEEHETIRRKRKRPIKIKHEGVDDEYPPAIHELLEENGDTLYQDRKHNDQFQAYYELVYDKISKMRAKRDAPVDTMGCAHLADRTQTLERQRFETLIALLMSSQTKDEITAAAIGRLREKSLLEPKIMAETESSILSEVIYPVGFYKRKGGYMKRVATIIHQDYKDDIPRKVEDILKLPGIGPKMAHLVMDHCWDERSGIGVDVHVHRIANRLRLVDTKGEATKNPEETRKSLESWLPKEQWSSINGLLVGFGQQVCSARSPKCHSCLLYKDGLCPTANLVENGVPKKKRRKK